MPNMLPVVIGGGLAAFVVCGGIVAGVVAWKKYPWLKYDWQWFRMAVQTVRMYKSLEKKGIMMIDLFEEHAKKHPEKIFLIFQDKEYSYGFMDKQANKAARVAQQLGLKCGYTVALMIHNSPEFLWTYLGFLKVGVQPALLNVNLRSRSLLHCFTASKATFLFVGSGDDLATAVADMHDDLQELGTSTYFQGPQDGLPEGCFSFDQLFDAASDAPIPVAERAKVQYEDPACFIYTSGTTGLPKAAIFSQSKSLKGGIFIWGTFGICSRDIVYLTMPLYHSAALKLGLTAIIRVGCTVVVRKSFSASRFWEDCRKHNVTVVQYIGELCRYLLAQPPSEEDQKHCVRVAAGNGLRMDIWKEFQQRFRIPNIVEYYAATENNAGFVNFFNKTGAVGRLSPLLQKMQPCFFIKCDYETAEPVRDQRGFCTQVKQGEAGLLVSQIRPDMPYYGYKGNSELSEKKVLRDVFREGDRFFNSGDLFTQDKDYFIYFTDRLGDTFRWKGENVSTIEVSNVIGDLPWIEDVNVYGVKVPGNEGRAGMAAILLTEGEDLSSSRLEELYRKCETMLPVYARPKFLRLKAEIELTPGTMKQKKMTLVEEGFHPSKAGGDLLFCENKGGNTFKPLDDVLYAKVMNGEIRL